MPSINQAGRETEHMVLPDDAKFVPVEEAHEHGYHGVSPDTTPRSEYTFAAQAAKVRGGGASKSTTSAASTGSKTTATGGTHRSADK